MLNWIRDKFFRRPSSLSTRVSNSFTEESEVNRPRTRPTLSQLYSNTTMHNDQTLANNHLQFDQISLLIICDGEVWTINVSMQNVITNLMDMALGHFLDPKNLQILNSKYKFILISQKRILNMLCTVQEEGLGDGDEIILIAPVSTGAKDYPKLTLNDIKGPDKEDIEVATAHLKKHNTIQVVPAIDCQENSFQSDIRRVLYSLVEASAKILAQNPDAKVIFDKIAAKINAKNKKEIDKNAIKYLKDLGFTDAQSRYALRLKRNRQIEAMEWLLENSHRVKDDWNDAPSTSTDPATDPTATSGDPLTVVLRLLQDIRDFHYRHFEPSGRALETLTAMGFQPDDVFQALRVTGNNQVAACEWLCGDRGPTEVKAEAGLDPDGPLFQALMKNPAIQLSLHNPKTMLAFLSILENPATANLWLNDVDTAPVLGQVFKTYHSEKHILIVNQQADLIRKQQKRS